MTLGNIASALVLGPLLAGFSSKEGLHSPNEIEPIDRCHVAHAQRQKDQGIALGRDP
jgi:hypothetical protein